jgi:hypothetical protein
MLNTGTNCPGNSQGVPSDTSTERNQVQLISTIDEFLFENPPSSCGDLFSQLVQGILPSGDKGPRPDYDPDALKDLIFQVHEIEQFFSKLYELRSPINYPA